MTKEFHLPWLWWSVMQFLMLRKWGMCNLWWHLRAFDFVFYFVNHIYLAKNHTTHRQCIEFLLNFSMKLYLSEIYCTLYLLSDWFWCAILFCFIQYNVTQVHLNDKEKWNHYLLINYINYFFGSNDESSYRVIKVPRIELLLHEMKLVS